MFNLCKSPYQAVLLKQRWNDLNQQFAKCQSAGEKCVSSALNWNYWSYIHNNKSCYATIQKALSKRHMAKENWWPKREPYQCGPPVKIVYKDNFKNFFQMTMFFLAYLVTFLGQVHFMRNYFFTVNTSVEQLLLQSSYFFGADSFSEHLLLLSSYSFKIVTYSEQHLFRKTNLLRISISTEEFLFRSRHFYKTSNFSE